MPLNRTFRWVAASAFAALALTGCVQQNPTDNPTRQVTDPQALEQDDQGYASVALHFVGTPGAVGTNETTYPFGTCGNVLVRKNSVPVHYENTEDAVAEALGFLLNTGQFYHGDPPVTNPVMLSQDTLKIKTIDAGISDITVDFTGSLATHTGCEAERAQAQIYATVAATAQTQDVTITLDGQDFADAVGTQPFDVSQLNID